MTPDDQVVETDNAPQGSRAATLQDYYRWDSARNHMREDDALPLIRCEGQPTFHALHLPLHYSDGSGTWKTDLAAEDWGQLEAEARRRISEAGKTEINKAGRFNGPDRRAQLQGTVLRDFPIPRPASSDRRANISLHLVANGAIILRECIAHALSFESATEFRGCAFIGSTSFSSAQFSGGNADFSHALFSGAYTYFYNTKFSGGNTDFKSSRFIGGYVGFEGAQFSGGSASFENARFSEGPVGFKSVNFSGGSANFRNAYFSGGDVDFKDVQFSGGGADFESAQFFGGSAGFENAIFSDGCANFKEALFAGGDANFKSAEFSGGNVNFQSAIFSGGNANFHSAQFSGGDENFKGILALCDLDFTRGRQGPQSAGKIASQPSRRMIQRGKISSVPDFTLHLTTPEAQMAMGGFRGFDLGAAYCFGPVKFADRRFSQAPRLASTQFFDRVELHGVSMHEGVDLAEARFKYDSDRDIAPPTLADILVKLQSQANAKILPENVRRLAEKHYQTAIQQFIDTNHQAARFESAYRTLKQLTAGIGARTEEQRFFALELKARQARTDSDVRVWEKRFAALYGAMSDYGQSLTRPFWWLVRLSAVMAAVYIALNLTAPTPAGAEPAPWPVASSQDRLATRHTRAVLARQTGYIASRVFQPGPIVYSIEITAIPLIDPNRHHPWARALSGEGASEEAPGLHPYLFALARLVHRILALPLVFLFLLTLRRRFQIS